MKKQFFLIFTMAILLIIGSCQKPDPKGNISGLIKDEVTNQPIENASVKLQLNGSDKGVTATNSKGTFEFKELDPNVYLLEITAADYIDNSVSVTVKDGQTESANVVMQPALGHVSGVVKNAHTGDILSGIIIRLLDGDNQINSYVTSTDGKYKFENLEPKNYIIEASKEGSFNTLTITITIKSGETLTQDINLEEADTGEPTLTTEQATGISATGAKVTGTITQTGNAEITAYGHCWSLTPAPDITQFKTNYGKTSTALQFTSSLTNLEAEKVYYVRAYATNSYGTAYSNEISFTTTENVTVPILTTTAASNITDKTATLGGNVTGNGGAAIIVRGVCYGVTENPTIDNDYTTNGSGTGSFTSSLSGLQPETKYFARAYATNGIGTAYGNQVIFTTLKEAQLPTVITAEITNIQKNSAEGGGNITDNGGGEITARGVCWNTMHSPSITDNHTTDGSETGSFTSNITGLSSNTTYYVRAYATNSAGTAYGSEVSFKTEAMVTLPVIITTLSEVKDYTAISGGNITSDGGAAVTSRGVCYSTSPNPTIANNPTTNGTGPGEFIANLSGLSKLTTYYIRAYAINSVGTAYGDMIIFKTHDQLPIVSTNPATNLYTTEAKLNGYAYYPTNSVNALKESGFVYSLNKDPQWTDSIIKDDTPHYEWYSYNLIATGLKRNSTYYFRAYVMNSYDTVFGDIQSYTTAIDAAEFSGLGISQIHSKSAVLSAAFTSLTNPDAVLDKGFCWSTSSNPTINDISVSKGSGRVSFSTTATNLTEMTTYYARAYATYSYGTIYSTEKSFTTIQELPVLTTTSITNITATEATSGGSITSAGDSVITARGVCWSTSSNPTINDYKTEDGTGTGSYTSTLSALTNNTTYFARAYATNYYGTAYGEEFSFTTMDGIPQLTTTEISEIRANEALSGGTITSDGGTSITAQGLCWSTSSNPTINDYNQPYSSNYASFSVRLRTLINNTTYYVRAYATNTYGTFYGNELSFTTMDGIPQLTTLDASAYNSTKGQSGGNITSDGGYYLSAKGICWNTTGSPTIDDETSVGTSTGTFTSEFAITSTNTTYYIRAYATNAIAGTVYGNEVTYISHHGETGTLNDYDGNTYNSVVIGDQIWMAENLRVTHYPNGTAIPRVTEPLVWASLDDNNTDDAYCWYDNDSITNSQTYGALYTWAAAMGDNATSSDANPSGVQGACPDGWHIPSSDEYQELIDFVIADGYSTSTNGTPLKSTSGWTTGNGTDIYGFNALPAGGRDYSYGSYSYGGSSSKFWSTSEYYDYNKDVYYIGLDYRSEVAWSTYTRTSKSGGYSVRCIKDE